MAGLAGDATKGVSNNLGQHPGLEGGEEELLCFKFKSLCMCYARSSRCALPARLGINLTTSPLSIPKETSFPHPCMPWPKNKAATE